MRLTKQQTEYSNNSNRSRQEIYQESQQKTPNPIANIKNMNKIIYDETSQLSRDLIRVVNSENNPEIKRGNISFSGERKEYLGNGKALNLATERAVEAVAIILGAQLKEGLKPVKATGFSKAEEYAVISFSKKDYYKAYGLERKKNSRGAMEVNGKFAKQAMEALNNATATAILPIGKNATAQNLRALLSYTPSQNNEVHGIDSSRKIELFIHETYFKTFENNKPSYIQIPSDFFAQLRKLKIRSKYVVRFIFWVAGHNFKDKEYLLKNTLKEMEMTNLSHRKPEVIKRIRQGIEIAKVLGMIQNGNIQDDKIRIIRQSDN
jgi:hypothetical protein